MTTTGKPPVGLAIAFASQPRRQRSVFAPESGKDFADSQRLIDAHHREIARLKIERIHLRRKLALMQVQS